jgi:NADH-quinone oxidoreductase subunit E
LSAPVGGPTTLIDPELYKKSTNGKGAQPALADAEAKKPGAAANVRDAAVPKPPVADSSDPRK